MLTFKEIVQGRPKCPICGDTLTLQRVDIEKRECILVCRTCAYRRKIRYETSAK